MKKAKTALIWIAGTTAFFVVIYLASEFGAAKVGG